jgi:Ca-activated chloride channel homolog
VRANGHLGLGNSLFQLGWKGLADETYPADPAALPNLGRFDTLVKKALAKLRESEAAEDTDTGNFVSIEALITNWADAVRHYDSALAQSPAEPVARQNREMTMTYLKRLKELLEEEKQAAEQAMPQPGEGQPQAGDGDKEGDKEGDKDGKSKKPGDNDGDGGKEPKDGNGNEGDKDKDGKNGKKPDKDKKDGEKKDGGNPNESPQERAHRILKENADPEKGPLAPGRREFRNAEKDW